MTRHATQSEAGPDALPPSPGTKAQSAGTVARALAVLDCFAPSGGTVGVSELARRSGLPKSTTHRLLAVLVEFGLVERTLAGYRLGRRLAELARVSVGSRLPDLRDRILPHLQDLYELTHETVQLAVMSGTDVLVLERLHGHRAVAAPIRVGDRQSPHCTAAGKVLLAYATEEVQRCVLNSTLLPLTPATIISPNRLGEAIRQVKEHGVAFDHEELARGIVSVAAPVLGPNRTAIAAISVTGGIGRFRPHEVASAVRRTAHTASVAIRRAALGAQVTRRPGDPTSGRAAAAQQPVYVV